LESTDSHLVAIVNNAGISNEGLVEINSIENVKKVFEVNFFGAYRVTQAFLSLVRNGGAGGRVINISSVAGFFSLPFMSGYAGSKHALEAFSDSLRCEVAPQKIAVSVIEPGLF
jgi:NAD(P)-dependent dehydrogenase (short-subunit alcohol dehydrogenase family)